MDYHAYFRTNYFWVNDASAFLAWVATLPGVEAHRCEPSAEDTAFGLFSDRGRPDFDDDDNEIEFTKHLSKHLAPGQVAILIEIGNEGLRYLNGQTMAVNSNGATITIDLDDIYARAQQAFGCEMSRAEY